MQKFVAKFARCRWAFSYAKRVYSNLVNLNDKKFQNYLNRLKKEYDEINESSRTDDVVKPINNERIIFLQNISHLRTSLEECKKSLHDLEDMASATTDKEFLQIAKSDIEEMSSKKTEIEEKLLQCLTPPDSKHENHENFHLSITAGAGGEEASLFAKEVFHMYTVYSSYKGWPFETLIYNESDIGGIKSATASVSGSDAFKCLRFEGGVHRVQRVPVNEKSGRMHTSTCSVVISPQPSDIEIFISPKDLRTDLKRASGNGGQNVNMRETAVRITHLPTKIAVDCQDERDQPTNYKIAMQRLRAILYERKFNEEKSKLERTRKLQMGSRERSEKIRTYNYADNLITDHRIKQKFTNLNNILTNGEEFDVIITSLLNFNRYERLFEAMGEK